MVWPAPVTNAITRLLAYIGTRYDATTNPYGLAGDGYKTNLPAAFNDMGAVADAVGQAATDVATIKSDVQTIANGIAAALADDVPVSTLGRDLVMASTAAAARALIGAAAAGGTSPLWGGAAGGTANALTATTGASLSSLTAGQIVGVKVGASANSGAATLNVDGIGAIAIRKNGSALVGGELTANSDAWFQYDGTNLRILGGSAVTLGAISLPVTVKSSAFSVTTSDGGKLFACSGTYSVPLPSATSAANGFTIAVSNVGSGTITISPNGADTVANRSVLTVAPSAGILCVSNGSNGWVVIGATLTSATTLDPAAKGADITLSNNNLTAVNASGTWASVRATTPIPQGKWYFEARADNTTSPATAFVGLAASTVAMSTSGLALNGVNCWTLTDNGTKVDNGSSASSWSAAWGAAGKVVGVHVDATNLASIKVWFSIDGTLLNSGDPVTGANPAVTITGNPTLYPAVSAIGGKILALRFAQSSFSYSPVASYNQLP